MSAQKVSQYWVGRYNLNSGRTHCLDCPPPPGHYSSMVGPVEHPADSGNVSCEVYDARPTTNHIDAAGEPVELCARCYEEMAAAQREIERRYLRSYHRERIATERSYRNHATRRSHGRPRGRKVKS